MNVFVHQSLTHKLTNVFVVVFPKSIKIIIIIEPMPMPPPLMNYRGGGNNFFTNKKIIIIFIDQNLAICSGIPNTSPHFTR